LTQVTAKPPAEKRIFAMCAGTPRRCCRHGFTLTELLVVIAIIGVLLGLLLPAVQAARESARLTQCRNNLKQLALAMTSHASELGAFPSNGWGYAWVGDPDSGPGSGQPGGWAYCVLPYIENSGQHSMGHGLRDAQKKQALAAASGLPIDVFACPTRPAPRIGPANPSLQPVNADWSASVVKIDYAINGGDFYAQCQPGPGSREDSRTYDWPDMQDSTGIASVHETVRLEEITDGLSHTYMLGEKFVNSQYYNSWQDLGYDQSALSGMCLDTTRWGTSPPRRDFAASWFG
jgi:prepilin-type N-terminal cleavage/methylation domain-containing protein